MKSVNETDTQEVAVITDATAIAIFDDEANFEHLFTRIKEEAAQCSDDMEDPKARKQIASMAYKVARTKTAIDEEGKKLTEDMRAQIKEIDGKRKSVRDRLDALKDEIRAPLNQWEEREKKREADAAAQLARIRTLPVVNIDTGIDEVRGRIDELRAMVIDETLHLEETAYVQNAASVSLESLKAVLERMEREERDRLELARLRQEAEEAAKRQEEEAAKREAEAKAKQEAEAEELRRIAAEKARLEQEQRDKQREAEILEKARLEAEARAREEAEAKAAKERAALEEQAAKERAEQERKLSEAKAAQAAVEQRERERIEAEQKAEAERKERAANQEHRGKIMRAAKEAMMEHGSIDEDTAKRVVLAICSGNVPHTTISF